MTKFKSSMVIRQIIQQGKSLIKMIHENIMVVIRRVL